MRTLLIAAILLSATACDAKEEAKQVDPKADESEAKATEAKAAPAPETKAAPAKTDEKAEPTAPTAK